MRLRHCFRTRKLQKVLAAVKPVASDLTAGNGQRGGTFVVTVDNPSDIPKLAEPFFLTSDASVEFVPFMTAEDLGRAGIDSLGKEWG